MIDQNYMYNLEFFLRNIFVYGLTSISLYQDLVFVMYELHLSYTKGQELQYAGTIEFLIL